MPAILCNPTLSVGMKPIHPRRSTRPHRRHEYLPVRILEQNVLLQRIVVRLAVVECNRRINHNDVGLIVCMQVVYDLSNLGQRKAVRIEGPCAPSIHVVWKRRWLGMSADIPGSELPYRRTHRCRSTRLPRVSDIEVAISVSLGRSTRSSTYIGIRVVGDHLRKGIYVLPAVLALMETVCPVRLLRGLPLRISLLECDRMS